jgi:hypothetical protein
MRTQFAQNRLSCLLAVFFLCFLMTSSLAAASSGKAEVSDATVAKKQTPNTKDAPSFLLENRTKTNFQKEKTSRFEKILQRKIAQQVEKKIAKKHTKTQQNATTKPHSDYEPTSLISFGLSSVAFICLLLAFGGIPVLFLPMTIFGLAGMIMGYMSLGERKRNGSKGLGFSLLGIILGKIAFLAALFVIAVLIAFAAGW